MVKAPFKTPVRNATPPLQPVWFSKSLQTNAFVARFFGITAHTMMVVRPPPRIKNRPRCCSFGMSLLPRMTNAVHSQVMIKKAT